MQAKRIKWQELKLAIEHWRLVFLNESGVNIGMTRRYGRAIGKARVRGSAPLNVPTSQTVLASVRLNGQITYTMYPGGTSGERFLDYLKNVLIPMLRRFLLFRREVDPVFKQLFSSGLISTISPSTKNCAIVMPNPLQIASCVASEGTVFLL